ncbi:MAG: ABC transporter ATP-binding protein [Smithellaceae bacterium]
MTENSIIHVESLIVKRGKVTVLDVPQFNVREGRSLSLIGPNGAGKSTLLLTMAGLLRPASGRLFFEDKPVNDRASLTFLRRNAAVVFQEPLLLNDNVYNNVALGLKFRHLSSGEISRSIDEVLAYFGITHLAKRSAKTLSGGEAKRVSLARAFAIKPRLILLDEAFNSLDPPSRETIIEDLQNILKQTKITAVLALHDREETLRLAQDVAVMSDGKIVQYGTAAQVFNQPADEFVANFVGTESILEGIVKTDSQDGIVIISIDGKTIEAVGSFSAGQKVYCCLRPENITISSSIQERISARNVFEARVDKMTRQGVFYKLILDIGFPLVAYVTQPSCEDLGLKEGVRVAASFKATAVHLMKREK